MGKQKYNYDDKKILMMINSGNYTIKSIAEYFNIPYVAMRYHIKKLIEKHNKKVRMNKINQRIPDGYRAVTTKEEFVRIMREIRMKREIEDSI